MTQTLAWTVPSKGKVRQWFEKINVLFQLALTFPDANKLRQLRLWFGGAPIGETYFEFGSGLGHSGQGTATGGTTILPIGEVKVNSFYTYSYALDFKKQTYNVVVTGQKKDGSPPEYSAQGLPFLKTTPVANVDSLFVLSGSRLATYLHDLKVVSK